MRHAKRQALAFELIFHRGENVTGTPAWRHGREACILRCAKGFECRLLLAAWLTDDPGPCEIGVDDLLEPSSEVDPPSRTIHERMVERFMMSLHGSWPGSEDDEGGRSSALQELQKHAGGVVALGRSGGQLVGGLLAGFK